MAADPTRRQLEALEDSWLAPWATRSASASRRYPVGDRGRSFDYRSPFQRDRDRIVYSRAFRRLRHKAQSGILPAYEDHRRNRLTHTLEVCQMARTIGRALRLNEDLVEAIALAHDLGQPPFGPDGQRALASLMSGHRDGHGGPGHGALGGFHRAWQGLRVVDLLEKRYSHPGINLTDDVRDGIFKCAADIPSPDPPIDAIDPQAPPSLEAQVVRVADRLATTLSDLDDGLQSGVVEPARVERLNAVLALRRKLGADYPTRGGRFVKANALHRGLTHWWATAAILNHRKRLAAWGRRHAIDSAARFAEVRSEALTGQEIALPKSIDEAVAEVGQLLDRTSRRGFAADRVAGRARRVVTGLFLAYFHDPTLLEDHVLLRYKDTVRVRYLRDVPRKELGTEVARRYQADPRFARHVADYLAGMTDPFALHEHARLMEMGAIPIPGSEQLRRETR